MSLFISSVFTYDEDAGNYIQAVETADAQALEPATRKAINNFVIGCKQDGIWTAIKASCILSGARTLAGALQPLAGTAPTNNGFIGIGTDYVRKTGLVGNGSTKYLNSNRNNNADPQNSKHISVYVTQQQSTSAVFMGTATSLNSPGDCYMYTAPTNTTSRLNGSSVFGLASKVTSGLAGLSRSQSSNYSARFNGIGYTTGTDTSQTPLSENIHVFKGGSQYANPRLAFYSIGEAIDLALLDARVADLINAFAVTIP